MNHLKGNCAFGILMLICVGAFLAPPALAQHGQAEAGYYPKAFIGDTWQGNVTAVDDQAHTITLTYTKGSKSQTLTVRFADGLAVNYTDGTSKAIKPSDIPIGSMALAYYTNYSEKVNGKKNDVHEAFLLKVKSVDDPKEHTYKSKFDPELKRWGVGGLQVSGAGEQ